MTIDSVRPRIWTLCIPLVPLLMYLAWAGSAADPRTAIPWSWTKTNWIVPAAGLGNVWIASALIFTTLSVLAYRILATSPFPAAPGRTFSLGPALFVFLIAVAIRAFIARTWIPLPLDVSVLAAKKLLPLQGWSSLVWLADLLTLAILLAALAAGKRSSWLAALYAFHPLPLIEIAGHGHRIALLLPLLLPAVIILNRPHRKLILAVSIAGSLAAIGAIAACASQQPFNSLASAILPAFPSFDDPAARAGFLIALQIILQCTLLVVANLRGWSFGRILVHAAVLFMLGSPVVYPWEVATIMLLLPFFWCRAGWVMSLTVLLAYLAVLLPLYHGHLQLPNWLLLAEWLPVTIVEGEELLAAAFHAAHPIEPIKTSPMPITVSP